MWSTDGSFLSGELYEVQKWENASSAKAKYQFCNFSLDVHQNEMGYSFASSFCQVWCNSIGKYTC